MPYKYMQNEFRRLLFDFKKQIYSLCVVCLSSCLLKLIQRWKSVHVLNEEFLNIKSNIKSLRCDMPQSMTQGLILEHCKCFRPKKGIAIFILCQPVQKFSFHMIGNDFFRVKAKNKAKKISNLTFQLIYLRVISILILICQLYYFFYFCIDNL